MTLPPGHLYGLSISNNAVYPSTHINIAPGSCRSLADDADILLASSVTKRLDAVWSAGTNCGGLDTGTKQPNTAYHAFAIDDPTALVSDAIFSASAVSPLMPSGFTSKRRLGAVLTDGSGNIRGFLQNGGWFHFTGVTAGPVHNNAVITTAVKLKQLVPTGVKVFADFSAILSGGSGNGFLAVRDPDLGNAAIYDGVGSGPALTSGGQMLCWTNTLGEVSFYGSSAGATVNVYPRGWYDGRDTYL